MRMRLNWYSEQIWSRLALAIIVGLVAVALFAGCRSSFHTMKQEVSRHETDSSTRPTKVHIKSV